MTRPEISIHVNLLERRTKSHNQEHYQTAIKVIKVYVPDEIRWLLLSKADVLEVRIYTDASYRGGRIEITNRDNDDLREPTRRMVQQTPGCGITFDNGSRELRMQRGYDSS